MVLIATGDPDLALKIGAVVDGSKSYVMRAESQVELRHKVHSNQPDVLMRIGGNRFEAMLGMEEIFSNVKSNPLVVVLLPTESEAARATAIEVGAYEVISLSRPSFLEELEQAVVDARSAKLAGVSSSVRRSLVIFH